MTSDESALRAAIWASPHEPMPRYMYADWLDEHGDPDRAEFIRVQTELFDRDSITNDARAVYLKRREAVLWRANRQRWTAALPVSLRRYRFKRGFPYGRIRGQTPERFAALPPAALVDCPTWHCRLVCPGTTDTVPPDTSLFARVDYLIADGPHVGRLIRALADTADGRTIGNLEVKRADASAGLLTPLSGSAWPALTHVFAEECALLAADLAALGQGPTATQLDCLMFVECQLDTDGLRALLTSPAVTAIRSFGAFGGSGFGPTELVAVSTAKWVSGLQWLVLGLQPWLDDSQVPLLAENPALRQLEALNLAYTGVGPPGAEAVARSSALAGLRELELRGTPAAADGRTRAMLRKRFGRRVRLDE